MANSQSSGASSQSGWNMISDGTYSNLTFGWRGDLSDPHHMLETILEYADWSDVQVSAGAGESQNRDSGWTTGQHVAEPTPRLPGS